MSDAWSRGVGGNELIDAAWAALISGRPKELRVLERLLTRPQTACQEASEGRDSVRRLELLLASTARNLRVMRGQFRKG